MISMVKTIMIAAIGVMVVGFLFFAVFSATIFGRVRKHVGRNDNAPRISVPARVVAKRMQVSRSHSQNARGMTTYYVTFELDSRDRMELFVHGHEYGLLIEGDQGMLTFQGDAFIDFRRH